MNFCTALLAVLLLGMPAAALDDRPKLTGVWRHGGPDSNTTYTIEQQDARITIRERTEFHNSRLSGGGSGEVTYVADAAEREAGNKERQSWTTVYYQGPSLVVLRVSKAGYRVTVTRETWTPSNDGLSLTKSKRTIDMDGVTETSQTFQRQ